MSEEAMSEERQRPRAWRRVLGIFGGLLLGGLLLFGAWAKVLDPLAFAETIRAEGLDFWLPAQVVVVVALALEIGIGTALLLGLRRPVVLIPASLLVVFFLFLTGRSYWRFAHGIGEEELGCGCFGNLVERTPAEAFWQDLVLMVPALGMTFLALAGGPFPRWRTGMVGLVTVLGLGLAWQAPSLPLDDLATRLKPGARLEEMCTGRDEDRICLGTIVPELETGEHTVVLADLEDDAFGEASGRLSDATASGLSLWVLSASPPEAHHAFFWRWGPTFEIREAPPALLRPLYRTLPRAFVLRDGEVTATYAGLPPVSATAAGDATGGL